MLELESQDIQDYAATLGVTDAAVEAMARQIRGFERNLSDLAGFSERELEAIYQRGMQLLDQGLAQRAGQIFFSLVQLQSRNPVYYRAVGLAFHHLQDWGWARHFYHIALHLAPNDPIACALMGECQLYMVGKRTAAGWLDKALRLPEPADEALPFLRRAQAIRAKIVL